MSKRNRSLLILFLVFLVANVLFLLSGKLRKGVSFEENRFTIQDTTAVNSLRIGEELVLERGPAGWVINDEYPADPDMVQLLLSIMNRVKVKKPVATDVMPGLEVAISGGEPMAFTIWGNPTKTRTYFSLTGSDEVYEVHIPGYNEYLGSIFELSPGRWRDRLVFDASWRTIQGLVLDYRDASDIRIQFDKDFFLVEGIEELDSNAVVEYLNQFQYFYTNEWINEGRFERYDSLSKMPPMATLTIETIDRELPMTLEIFPQMAGDRFYLLEIYDGSKLVVDEKRMAGILVGKDYFLRKEASVE